MALTYIIFDLDDTLYPRDDGPMREIGRRIQQWLCDHLELSWEDAFVMRQDYFRRYGTTLGGLIARHEVDVSDFLTYVHDLPVEEYLDPDPALGAMLASIPLRKVVYTNGTSGYGKRVLHALQVADHFEQVVGIEEVGLRNKFNLDAYERMLALVDARGAECVMVEDIASNLRPAKALGLTTVLVDTGGSMDWLGDAPELAPSSPDHVDFVVRSVLEVGPLVNDLLARGRG